MTKYCEECGARISAERQATVPPPDGGLNMDVARALVDAFHPTEMGDDYSDEEIHALANYYMPAVGIVTHVRQALGAWPQVPQGWEFVGIHRSAHLGDLIAYIADGDGIHRDGRGDTPQEALQAAIDQIGGAE